MCFHVLEKKNERDGATTCGSRVYEPSGQGKSSSRLSRPHRDTSYEFQLKSAGLSRSADCPAVPHSSIPMHVLGIPTTRSPEMPVTRERLEKACVTTRVAETFIWIGGFEALSPPESAMSFFGGRRWSSKWPERNAKMVAAWQAYGFIHGVINADKQVSKSLHLTPTKNSRYTYVDNIFAASMLAVSYLTHSPLIGAEIALGNKVVQEAGLTTEHDMALRRVDPSDQRTIFQPLLDMMENRRLDHHGTFRNPAFFRPQILRGDDDSGATALEGFIAGLLETLAGRQKNEEWLDARVARIESEKTGGEWGEDFDETRERAAMAANPRFVLRQRLLEEVIKKVEDGPATGEHVLAKVMRMVCSLFKPWGREGANMPDEELREEERKERRYCGLGDRRMFGFQCSLDVSSLASFSTYVSSNQSAGGVYVTCAHM
ncbi:hypothetical protein EDD15DRAFT_2522739 [Pisolithus albus]|nr:hypothetical protein EDD15DRAFT_2522739 [Pisolithus albus]